MQQDLQQVEDIIVRLSKPQEVLMETRAQRVLDMAGQGAGKSQNIGYHTGMLITVFPRVRGFIGANTYDQLSGATLKNCYEVWRTIYGLTEYGKENPAGTFVVDKKPPPHFQQFIKLRSYKNVMCFWNGAIVILGSLDNYAAHDGKEFGWAHLDETKDTKEEAVKDVITGRLRQRGLWYDVTGELIFNQELTNDEAEFLNYKSWNPLFIHTSPASGLTVWLNDWFKLSAEKELILEKLLRKENDFYYRENPEARTCAVIYSAYHNKDNLPLGKLEAQEQDLGPAKALKLVYGYPFSKSGGEWYTDFEELVHVQTVEHIKGLNEHMTWDFNVLPYMTNLAVQIQYLVKWLDKEGNKHNLPVDSGTQIDVIQIRVYKEYCLEPPKNTTRAVCGKWKEEHPLGNFDTFYYGDSSGLSRIPGLGSDSNFKFIEEELFNYFNDDSKRVKHPNIAVSTRRDIMNDIFSGRLPYVEVIIDHSCEMLIKDCKNVKQGADGGKLKTRVKDETTGQSWEELGHPSDALEYLVCWIAKPFVKL